MRVGAGIVNVSWAKRKRSMSLISPLMLTSRALTSKVSAVTFATVEGS